MDEELIGDLEKEEDLSYLYYSDIIDDNLDRKYGNVYTNLDRIHDEHESDEAQLRAVVKEFLTKSDGSWSLALPMMQSQKSQTWRRVIWALYCTHEIEKAQQIRSYAEPLQGMLEQDLRVLCSVTRPRWSHPLVAIHYWTQFQWPAL